MSYSSYPYSAQAYHLAVTLANVGNTIGSVVAQFVPHTSFIILDTMMGVVILTGAYIFFIATQSPNPPLVHTTSGSVMIVCILCGFDVVLHKVESQLISSFHRFHCGSSSLAFKVI